MHLEPDRRKDDVPGNRRVDDKVLQAVHEIKDVLAKEHGENRSDIAEIKQNIERILNGFPGGDPESHRAYHQTIIEGLANRNALKREILIKASTTGSIVGLGWLCLALWEFFKDAISK